MDFVHPVMWRGDRDRRYILAPGTQFQADRAIGRVLRFGLSVMVAGCSKKHHGTINLGAQLDGWNFPKYPATQNMIQYLV